MRVEKTKQKYKNYKIITSESSLGFTIQDNKNIVTEMSPITFKILYHKFARECYFA